LNVYVATTDWAALVAADREGARAPVLVTYVAATD